MARDTAGVTEDYNITYLPTTYIIDQNGYIRHKHVGVVDAGETILKKELEIVIPEYSSTVLLLVYMAAATLVVSATKYRKRLRRLLSLLESNNLYMDSQVEDLGFTLPL